MEFRRRVEEFAAETAQSFRAMIVSGPRQVGKTWLLTDTKWTCWSSKAASVKAADVERNFRVCREACNPIMRMGCVILISDKLGAVDAQTATIPVGFLWENK